MVAETQQLLFDLMSQSSRPQSGMLTTEAAGRPDQAWRAFIHPGLQSGPQHIFMETHDLPIRHQREDKCPPFDDYEPGSKRNIPGLTTWFNIAHDPL